MDEGLKAASYLGDNMFDPSTSHSEDANKAPIQRAMHTNLPIFEWLEKPENATALRKFHIGFGSMGKISLDAISSQGQYCACVRSFRALNGAIRVCMVLVARRKYRCRCCRRSGKRLDDPNSEVSTLALRCSGQSSGYTTCPRRK